ncbi:MAG: DUF1289 domain-containing protein [Betaproteobacteria bacterium]
MKSPCVKVCQMDPARGVCIGCLRTLDEIACWGGMSDAEREAILSELPRRNGEVQRASRAPAGFTSR